MGFRFVADVFFLSPSAPPVSTSQHLRSQLEIVELTVRQCERGVQHAIVGPADQQKLSSLNDATTIAKKITRCVCIMWMQRTIK